MKPRLSSNSQQSSYLGLLCAGITGICLHTQKKNGFESKNIKFWSSLLHKNRYLSWTRYLPAILALGRLKQEDCGFKASLGDITNFRLAWTT